MNGRGGETKRTEYGGLGGLLGLVNPGRCKCVRRCWVLMGGRQISCIWSMVMKNSLLLPESQVEVTSTIARFGSFFPKKFLF